MAAAVAALAVFLVTAGSALARPGDLDPAFGAHGITGTTFVPQLSGTASNGLEAIGLQGDEPVLAGGAYVSQCSRIVCYSVGARFVAARLRANGEPDQSFGDGGRVATDLGLGPDASFPDAAMAEDGGILGVAIGQAAASAEVFRLTPDGQLDGDFAGDGRAELSPGGGFAPVGARIAVQSDGKIVVAILGYDGSGTQLRLSRLEPDGAPDPSFNPPPPEVVSGPFRTLGTMLADSHDRIVLALGGEGAPTVRRYLAAGPTDSAFGSSGEVVLPSRMRDSLGAPRLAADSADRVLALGGGSFVARLDDAGTLDASFAGDGVADLTPRRFGAVAAEPEGGVLVASAQTRRPAVGGSALTLARLDPGGALDPSFGEGGVATVYPDLVDAEGASLLPTGDGAVLVTGSAHSISATAARFRLDAGAPDDLDADGVLDPKDRCPGRYAPKEGNGCPVYERTVTLHRLSARRVEGSLSSGLARCVSNAHIRFVTGAKPHRLVGGKTTRRSVRTRTDYRTRLRRPVRSRVMAEVSSRIYPTIGECGADRTRAQLPPGR